MSAFTPIPNTRHDHQKFHLFVLIAFFMAIITGVELVLIYMPFSYWTLFTALMILSAIKFFAVIIYFMHLYWDQLFLTILFLMGLVIGGGTLAALMALFWTDRTENHLDEFAVAPLLSLCSFLLS